MNLQIMPRAARGTAVEPFSTPFGGSNRLNRLVNRMWNDMESLFARESLWPIQRLIAGDPGTAGGFERPNLTVRDEEDAVVICAETPGFAAEEIDLKVDAQGFTLEASHAAETREGEAKSYESGRLYESISLPPGIDADKAEAHYANGVLTVRLPKGPSARSKKISIQKA